MKHFKNILINLTYLIFIVVGGNSQAALITVDFSGQITSLNDRDGLLGYAASNQAIGADYSGQFWFDTSLAPTPEMSRFMSYPENNVATYEKESNQWMGMAFTINDNTYDISNSFDNLDNTEYAKLMYNMGQFDQLEVMEKQYGYRDKFFFDGHEQMARLMMGELRIYDYNTDFLKGTTLDSLSSWQKSPVGGVGEASFVFTEKLFIQHPFGTDYTVYSSAAFMNMNVTTMDVFVDGNYVTDIVSTEVPEPASLLIFGLGLIGVLLTKSPFSKKLNDQIKY